MAGACAICALVVLGAGCGPAYAQDGDVNSTLYSVLERPRPGWTPQGIHIGSFLLYPSISAGALYDDNIYATAEDQKQDTIFTVRPELWAKSDWNRHSFNAYVIGDLNKYATYSSDDHNDIFTGAESTIDIRRDLKARTTIKYDSTYEPRGTGESFAQYDELVNVHSLEGTGSLTKRFNRVAISGGVAAENGNYDDTSIEGVAVDQDYRDGTTLTYSGRAAYYISPLTNVFVQADTNTRDYRGYTYDSEGQQVVGGVSFEAGRLIQGEAYVGWMVQDYDNPDFDNLSTVTYGGKLLWLLTEMTNVTFTGSREPGISSYNNGTSRLQSQVGMRVDHELLRNVIVSGSVGYEWDDYGDTGRTDEYLNVGSSVTYYLNQMTALAFNYRYMDFTTDGLGVYDYDRQQVGATLKVQY